MALTYAGYDVVAPTPELRVMMERWWEMQDAPLWQWPGYGVERLHHLPVPDHPPTEKARLNTLVWPTGASRWAVFHCLVGTYSASGIASATASTTSPTSGTLRITNDTDVTQTVSTQMYVAAHRPVFVSGVGRLTWLTLVDQRFFWWDKPATYTYAASWTNLLVNLVTAASGSGPTAYAVNAAYGVPNALRWTNPGKPLPLVIDAAAATVGLRLVRYLDGTSAFVAPATALTAQSARHALYLTEVAQGGLNAASDLAGSIPATVAVSYWGDAQTVHTKTLASLALTEYSAITGVAGQYGWVQADADARTLTDTYSDQATSDYYKWRLSLAECTFRGILPLTGPCGLEDRLEWEYCPGVWDHAAYPAKDVLDKELSWQRLATRVVRAPLGDANVWGDRPPPGYTYLVKLTATNGTAWKATIQTTGTGAVADGPQLGWGADSYCLYVTGTASAGDYATAAPDPLLPQRWLGKAIRVPGEPGGGVSMAECSWLASLADDDCLILTVPTAPTGGCACCIDDDQTFTLFPQGSGVWQSTDDFLTCTGSGVVKLDLSDPCCRPKLTLVGVVPGVASAPATDYVMWPAGCGLDADSDNFADFAGSSSLCDGTDICDCAACPAGTFTTWRAYFDFTGITSTCSASLAGNWEFTRAAAGTCVWVGVGPAGAAATLTVSGTTGTLVFTASGLTYALDPWDCDDTNVLARTALGSCDAAPATVTVCPVPPTGCRDSRFKIRLTCGACVPSEACAPGAAYQIGVHLTQVGSDPTLCDTCLPTDLVLTYNPLYHAWMAGVEVAAGCPGTAPTGGNPYYQCPAPHHYMVFLQCGSPNWTLTVLGEVADNTGATYHPPWCGYDPTLPGQVTYSSGRCALFTGSVAVDYVGGKITGGTLAPVTVGGCLAEAQNSNCGWTASAPRNCATSPPPSPPPPPTRHSCIDGICTPTVGGTFASLAECVAAGCSPPPPPPPPPTACCDFATHTAQVTVPSGAYAAASPYSGIFNEDGTATGVGFFSGPHPFTVFCFTSSGNPGTWVLEDYLGNLTSATSVSCGPPGSIVFPGAALGSSGSITVTVS